VKLLLYWIADALCVCWFVITCYSGELSVMLQVLRRIDGAYTHVLLLEATWSNIRTYQRYGACALTVWR
jgi:hypothetical protein